jgi:hypothetical protein
MSVLTVTLAAGPTASAQETWKLYDLRDLIAVLPPTTLPEQPAIASQVPPFQTWDIGAPARPPEPPTLTAGVRSADELMKRVCGALGVTYAPFLGGVYGIEGGEAEHAQVRQLLEQIRSLYAERYAVELVWFTAPAGETPSIGDEVAPAQPHHRHRLVVARRTPTPLVVATHYSYISDVSAVVATGSALHDPRTGNTDAGMRLSVLVGAGPEEADTTSIQLVGELRRVTMGKTSGPVGTAETGSMAIELPTVSTRSIRTDLRIAHGKMTVLNILDGFGEGECTVLAGSVGKL